MKTLERFWHWHRNETPGPDLAGAMLQKNLSARATLAVVEAQRLIGQYMVPRAEDWPALMPALERLSRALCATYEEIEELRKARADKVFGPERP